MQNSSDLNVKRGKRQFGCSILSAKLDDRPDFVDSPIKTKQKYSEADHKTWSAAILQIETDLCAWP